MMKTRNFTPVFVTMLICFTGCTIDVELPAGAIVEMQDSRVYAAPETVMGHKNYIEYIVGDANSPIILSSPHGGSETPESIPDRKSGVVDPDTNTQELTRDVADEIFKLTGIRPHVVICRLHRKKLDVNRSYAEASDGNADAVKAWNDYHSFIRAASKSVVANRSKGLYLDMHGHGHSISRVEVGYLLDRNDLAKENGEVNEMFVKSSIRALATESSLTFSELLRGAASFGTMLDQNGYRAVPSLSDPQPGISNDFFEGGYSTRLHGSAEAGAISAIQLETYRSGLRDVDQNRKAFAKKMALIIREYLKVHYKIAI